MRAASFAAAPLLAVACAASAAGAGAGKTDTLQAELERLSARVAELERERAEQQSALDEPSISADEPPLAARLKAVESQASGYRRTVGALEGLDGIEVEAGLTLVGQGARGGEAATGRELNYRADVEVTVPAGSLGNASESFLFGHFRMGQGRGLQAPGPAFASTNASSFQRPGTEPSDSTVLLAQAWYQVNLPLPLGGNPTLSRRHVEFNVGKMDPFGFFDQNAVADDETRAFNNQAFVHNPLLDVGGDIGVDAFGFTPGIRLAYVDDSRKPASYGVSAAVFGAGSGAGYEDALRSPLAMVQAETSQRILGLTGRYRLYAWRNGRGGDFDGAQARHAGVGLSLDQQVHDYLTLFARVGAQLEGRVRFDRAATVGAEFGGSYWNRGADALGLAIGQMQVGDEFERESATVDGDADGTPDFGYAARGAETVAELYYRYFVGPAFVVSPSVQHLRRPGGDAAADDVSVVGLRLQLSY
ncbi:MAG: carbohydrate porin [Gammaproteobacteria bacterium]|nr:carbohydrate porin [Gammaproteobacteria bacterium]